MHGQTDNGPMDGTVIQLGWNDRLIVAQRKAVSGGTLAWMILDTKAETLEGPFTDEEFKVRLQVTPQLASIEVRAAEDAWQALR